MDHDWQAEDLIEADDPAPGGVREGEATDIGDSIADIGPDTSPRQSPQRPSLGRNASSQPPPFEALPPPNHPPPPPGGGTSSEAQANDSMSLAQLRQLVAELPRDQPAAYDFIYQDAGPIEEEIDEWFVYQFWQWVRLNASQRAFTSRWSRDGNTEALWEDATEGKKRTFISNTILGLESENSVERVACANGLLYLVLGRWEQTAGGAASIDKTRRSAAAATQLQAMTDAARLVAQTDGIPIIWRALQRAFDNFWPKIIDDGAAGLLHETQDECMNLMTILYMIIQQAYSNTEKVGQARKQLLQLQPPLTDYFVDAIAMLRWNESQAIAPGHIFLLLWKSILLAWGGANEIQETKDATAESLKPSKDLITASPLDYHFFRQELISKYPAYIPPQPTLNLEADKVSLLPLVANQAARAGGGGGILPSYPGAQVGGASILDQPVHIATPAPSPPPSPGVNGKGAKKQNYQTNQNFPFMYPPLDASSNSFGGKGPAAMQDSIVGRKWEGSDVPVSISEAGELFSNRVKLTRAARQLWEEREKFLKHEQGHEAPEAEIHNDDILEELDLSELTLEEREILGLVKPAKEGHGAKPGIDLGPRPEAMPEVVKERLADIDRFYSRSISKLQSVVITLLKAVLAHYAVVMAMNPAGSPPSATQSGPPNGRQNGPNARSQESNGTSTTLAEPPELTPEEVDATRTREITCKAVTGILLLLLKWFKVSHVLKFEYLSQLLLDCNYMPLVLKLFFHQDVQQVVESKTDRLENSFFYFCNVRAEANEKTPSEPVLEEDTDEDDAAPPPIKFNRPPPPPVPAPPPPPPPTSISASAPAPASAPPPPPPPTQPADSTIDSPNAPPAVPIAPTAPRAEPLPIMPPPRPEVDELGYPVYPLPKEPITDFSRRNFFTTINYLRILQKICKHKVHRDLLLMHYKSSQYLRRNLRVPQPELRLYTLKIFKTQVPYCGRKWRQSNMRVITAIYLHCRPELRDAWLAGSDVDAEVEEALPLEQALRSLTHWFNVKRYPEEMAPEVRDALRDEQDFFVRELEKMELNWDDAGPESVNSEWGNEINGY